MEHAEWVPVFDVGAFVGAPEGERSDAAESRGRILAEARRMFEARGVGAVSMHEISRSLGIGQGTLYRRFAHKGTLCAALLAEEVEGLSRDVYARAERGGSATEQLLWLMGRLADFNEANAPLLAGIRDAADGERRVEMYRNPFYEWLREVVAALLELGIADREVRSDVDAELTADSLLAALGVDLYVYQRGELGVSRDRIIAALGVMIEGLGPVKKR